MLNCRQKSCQQDSDNPDCHQQLGQSDAAAASTVGSSALKDEACCRSGDQRHRAQEHRKIRAARRLGLRENEGFTGPLLLKAIQFDPSNLSIGWFENFCHLSLFVEPVVDDAMRTSIDNQDGRRGQ